MQVSGIRESSRGGRTPRCTKPRHHQSLKDCANLDVPIEAWISLTRWQSLSRQEQEKLPPICQPILLTDTEPIFWDFSLA